MGLGACTCRSTELSLSGIYLNEENSDGPCSKQNNRLFGETFCSPVN